MTASTQAARWAIAVVAVLAGCASEPRPTEPVSVATAVIEPADLAAEPPSADREPPPADEATRIAAVCVRACDEDVRCMASMLNLEALPPALRQTMEQIHGDLVAMLRAARDPAVRAERCRDNCRTGTSLAPAGPLDQVERCLDLACSDRSKCLSDAAGGCSGPCQDEGLCISSNGGCVATSDSDCLRSRACKGQDRCTARDGVCVAPP